MQFKHLNITRTTATSAEVNHKD